MEHGGKGGHALNNIRNGLGLNRMDRPENSRKSRDKMPVFPVFSFQGWSVEKPVDYEIKNETCENVNHYIYDVISEYIIFSEIPVQCKRQPGESTRAFTLGKQNLVQGSYIQI